MAKAYDRVRGLDNLFDIYPLMKFHSGRAFGISHLAYVDDIMIFSNGSIRNVQRLRNFLDHYEECSGQLISNVKSVVISLTSFSVGVKEKTLSYHGFGDGSLLIRVFIPRVTVPWNSQSSIRNALCQVFMGFKEGAKKTHWIAWEKVCLPAAEGGIERVTSGGPIKACGVSHLKKNVENSGNSRNWYWLEDWSRRQ
ncbi:uncharacterized protein [Henckelia pumila]|uniref:uncharacterized protein n=1 Tax=Henckelia pumila TaxID=405737 RepID=UPI003C6E630F